MSAIAKRDGAKVEGLEANEYEIDERELNHHHLLLLLLFSSELTVTIAKCMGGTEREDKLFQTGREGLICASFR